MVIVHGVASNLEPLGGGTFYRYIGLCISLDFIASNVLFFFFFWCEFFQKKNGGVKGMVVLELFHLFLF